VGGIIDNKDSVCDWEDFGAALSLGLSGVNGCLPEMTP
jgi:hypothetical protein